MKPFITDIIMALGTAAALILSSFSTFSQQCESLQDEVLRLHIPANSDSPADQQTKLALRDYLLEKYSAQLSSGSLADAESRVLSLLPEIEQDADAFLLANGADYTAKAELVNMYFTTRVYSNLIMPAGSYDALRVTLGSGEGHNWWCIMFPPLCIPAVSSTDDGSVTSDTAEISPDDVTLTTSEITALQPTDGALYCDSGCGRVEIKFALYEFFKWLIG